KIVGRPVIEALATRDLDEVRLTGGLEATVQIVCARCLGPVEVPIEEDFDLFYVPAADPRLLNEERELAEEDLTVGVYRGDFIDLADVVREQIELTLPMARLCSEDCRGLCVDCGANLNEGGCSCPARGDAIAGLA
ncbi:MAG TPA: DUF177 domain-containing protein, partial [Blastocatellia bacterium]|nr:DUF177 domain-containing protein [Blastocatellia bacterium]